MRYRISLERLEVITMVHQCSPTGFIHLEGSSNGTETYGRFSYWFKQMETPKFIHSNKHQAHETRDHMALQVIGSYRSGSQYR